MAMCWTWKVLKRVFQFWRLVDGSLFSEMRNNGFWGKITRYVLLSVEYCGIS